MWDVLVGTPYLHWVLPTQLAQERFQGRHGCFSKVNNLWSCVGGIGPMSLHWLIGPIPPTHSSLASKALPSGLVSW